MKRLDDPPRCKTCAYWEQVYPEKSPLGKCPKIGGIVYGKNISIGVATDDSSAISDFEETRVLDSFGCYAHSDFIMARYTY